MRLTIAVQIRRLRVDLDPCVGHGAIDYGRDRKTDPRWHGCRLAGGKADICAVRRSHLEDHAEAGREASNREAGGVGSARRAVRNRRPCAVHLTLHPPSVLANKVALITGASRGIGKQLAIDFADAGYDIVAVARSTAASPTKLPGTIDETAQLVRDAGQRCVTIGADLQEADAIDRIVDTTYAELGQVDVLINNAAVAPPGKALDGSRNRWRLAVDINVNAPFYLMHAICPRMAASGGGAVINIGSGAAISPEFGRVSYTTTKRALEAMSESLAHDLAGTGVSVNCLRLELSVYSEGYAFTLGERAKEMEFEDPIIMSDACLWMVAQGPEWTGRIVTIADLRKYGAVRPQTLKQFD